MVFEIIPGLEWVASLGIMFSLLMFYMSMAPDEDLL